MSDKLLLELITTVARIEQKVSINTKDLSEHKEGVIQCRQRLDILENTYHQILGATKVIKVVGWLIPIILVGFKLVEYISK